MTHADNSGWTCYRLVHARTMIGRVARASEGIVGCQLQVQILLAEETVHESDELQDELVLSQVVSSLEHDLWAQVGGMWSQTRLA